MTKRTAFTSMAEIVLILKERSLGCSSVIWRTILQIQDDLWVSQHQWLSFELLKFAVLEVHADVEGLIIQQKNQACCTREFFYKQLGIFMYKASSVVPLFHNYSAKLQLVSHL